MDRRAYGAWVGLIAIGVSFAVALFGASDDAPVAVRPTPPAIEAGSARQRPVIIESEAQPIERIEVVATERELESTTAPGERPSVRIRVVDSSGIPVEDSSIAWGRAREGLLPPYRSSTDANGIVMLDASELDALFGDEPEPRLAVTSLEAIGETYRVEKSRADAEATGIDLTIPAAARVVVEVLEGGAAFLGDAVVHLEGSVPGVDGHGPIGSRPALLGRAEFSRVGVGLHVRARASLHGISARSEDDPSRITAPGTITSLRIVVPLLARLSFRILDPEGAPLRDAMIGVEREGAPERLGSPTMIRLDGDGRGTIAWPIEESPSSAPRLRFSGSTPGGPATASIAPFSPLRPGAIELGDVSLATIPLAVDGRVLTRNGEPLADASVTALSESPFRGIELRTRTNAGGEFELRLPRELGTFRLRVDAPGFLGEILEVAHGTRGVDVVLRRLGSISGSLRFTGASRAAPPEVVIEVLRRVEDDAHQFLVDRSASHRIGAHGEFEITNLHPGRVRILFSKVESDESVIVDDVNVELETTSLDPRLRDVELPW
jgi:hypothetical protein